MPTLTRPNELPQISAKTPADGTEHDSFALPSHMDVDTVQQPFIEPFSSSAWQHIASSASHSSTAAHEWRKKMLFMTEHCGACSRC